MQQIHENASAATVDAALRFLRIRLGSRPDTNDLARPVEDARKRVVATDEVWGETRDARRAATAGVQYVDEQLDNEVMALSREALVLTHGNRDDPRYKKLFPIAPSKAMAEVGGDAQARFVKQILTRLVEDADLAELRGKEKTIAARLAELEQAVKQRNDLYVPEASAQSDRRRAIEDARQLYKTTYLQLRLLLADDALVESFFQRTGSTRAVSDDDVASEIVS